jgi:hypothetical protein
VTAARRSSAFGTRATRLAAVATELPPLRRRPGRPGGGVDRPVPPPRTHRRRGCRQPPSRRRRAVPLRTCRPRDKAELYSRTGLRLTYRPGPESMISEVVAPANNGVFDWCPRGDRHRRRGRQARHWRGAATPPRRRDRHRYASRHGPPMAAMLETGYDIPPNVSCGHLAAGCPLGRSCRPFPIMDRLTGPKLRRTSLAGRMANSHGRLRIDHADHGWSTPSDRYVDRTGFRTAHQLGT